MEPPATKMVAMLVVGWGKMKMNWRIFCKKDP